MSNTAGGRGGGGRVGGGRIVRKNERLFPGRGGRRRIPLESPCLFEEGVLGEGEVFGYLNGERTGKPGRPIGT